MKWPPQLSKKSEQTPQNPFRFHLLFTNEVGGGNGGRSRRRGLAEPGGRTAAASVGLLWRVRLRTIELLLLLLVLPQEQVKLG